MASNPVTPWGFHTHGKEFFAAAEVVHATKRHPMLPLAFLWGRAIELLLKSYLLSVAVPIARLRSKQFGHNLVALHKETKSRGIDALIGSEPTITDLMQLLNFVYGSKRLKYRESGTMHKMPDAKIAKLVIRRLLKGVDFHLRQNGI